MLFPRKKYYVVTLLHVIGKSKGILKERTCLPSVPHFSTILAMNSKHLKTLNAIFAKPTQAGVLWSDIEALLITLDAEISEGNGSRVRIALKGVRAVFHRPHPQKETDKGALKSVRRFLEAAGVRPC